MEDCRAKRNVNYGGPAQEVLEVTNQQLKLWQKKKNLAKLKSFVLIYLADVSKHKTTYYLLFCVVIDKPLLCRSTMKKGKWGKKYIYKRHSLRRKTITSKFSVGVIVWSER